MLPIQSFGSVVNEWVQIRVGVGVVYGFGVAKQDQSSEKLMANWIVNVESEMSRVFGLVLGGNVCLTQLDLFGGKLKIILYMPKHKNTAL